MSARHPRSSDQVVRVRCAAVLACVTLSACASTASSGRDAYLAVIGQAARQVATDLRLDPASLELVRVLRPSELQQVHTKYLEWQRIPDVGTVWAVDIMQAQRLDRIVVGGGVTVFFREPSPSPFLIWRHE